MKRITVFLMILAMTLSGCAQVKKDVYQSSDITDFTAIVSSDLHFTLDPDSASTVVPAEPYSREFMEAFVSQVIAEHPNVFILTGDNTNTGNPDDERALASILERVRDAGIPVVMTTGNHDYDFSDADTYEENYASLLEMEDRDPSSLSYVRRIGDVTLLAMDDGAVDQGRIPQFSKETMKWLKEKLKEASLRNDKIIFLAHRSVLYKADDERYASYHIQNEGLYDLLVKYHVQLALTGHQHHPSILVKDSLHEIISGMPLTDTHCFGVLSIMGKDVSFSTEPIDFSAYGSQQCVSDMAAADQQAVDNQLATVEELLKNAESDPLYEQGKSLLLNIFTALKEGSLGAQAGTFRADPALALVQAQLADTNYGPWLQDLLADPPADPNHLSFVWQNGR